MSEGAKIVGAVLVLMVLLAAFVFCEIQRLDALEHRIDRWATERGYDVRNVERCVLDRGPFWWATSESARVFRADAIKDGVSSRVWFLFGTSGMDFEFEGDAK